MTTSAEPDYAPVLDLIEAYRRSQTMFTGVSMGVFDALHSAPARAAELAVQIHAHAGALELLLDGCAALGLLEKRDGVYRNTAVSERYLCSTSRESLRGYVMYSHDALYAMWQHLDDAVREGTHRWRQTFGLEGAIFSHFFRTDDAMQDFLMGMHGHGLISSGKVAAAFDLGRFRKLVDLGSATGHLVMACCERYEQLHGVIFDLPRAAPLARALSARSPAASRIEVVSGDFFEDELPPADLYALGQILHDWAEDRIALLLEKICRALPDGGGLLIAEKLMNEDGVGPLAGNMQSLSMLICTEGRERSAGEYERLLRTAGFRSVEARRTGVRLDAVLAVK